VIALHVVRLEGGRGETSAGHLFCVHAHVTRELPSLDCDELDETFEMGRGPGK
jgi:hypothetical protein